MDKKTLISFALMGSLLIAFGFIYNKKSKIEAPADLKVTHANELKADVGDWDMYAYGKKYSFSSDALCTSKRKNTEVEESKLIFEATGTVDGDKGSFTLRSNYKPVQEKRSLSSINSKGEFIEEPASIAVFVHGLPKTVESENCQFSSQKVAESSRVNLSVNCKSNGFALKGSVSCNHVDSSVF